VDLEEKRQRLIDLLRSFERVVVAFSGGVDSTLVAALAREALGERAEAVTGVSPSVPARERAEAERLAREIGIAHRWIETGELARPEYVANTALRCFHCKDELYGLLRRLVAESNGAVVVDGTNADDLTDWRPGREAARQHGGRSPLAEVGVTKAEVRELARRMGLSNWDKPAMACLASRIPHGTPVTVETLHRVDEAEEGLRALGFRQLRVRHHGDIARLELDEEGFALLADPELRAKAVAAVRRAGYRFVTLDLEGYRSGSLNPPPARPG